MISGSLEWENNQRLKVLYTKHNDWLNAVAYKLTRDYDEACDLVSSVYLFLGEKINPKLFYLDSFNLQYLRSFISSRFLNSVKREGRKTNIDVVETYHQLEDTPYDEESDRRFEEAYWGVMTELNEMKATPKWASGKLFEIYHFSDMTLDEVATDVGISKATCFLHVKKTKTMLKTKIKNPFNE